MKLLLSLDIYSVIFKGFLFYCSDMINGKSNSSKNTFCLVKFFQFSHVLSGTNYYKYCPREYKVDFIEIFSLAKTVQNYKLYYVLLFVSTM